MDIFILIDIVYLYHIQIYIFNLYFVLNKDSEIEIDLQGQRNGNGMRRFIDFDSSNLRLFRVVIHVYVTLATMTSRENGDICVVWKLSAISFFFF